MKNLFIGLLFLFNTNFSFGEASRSFDGTGDRLGQGDIFNVTTGNISICGFHKFTDDSSQDLFLGKRNSADTIGIGYNLFQNTSDLMVASTFNQNAVATTDCDAIWCVTCMTLDNTSDITLIYTNGVQEDSDDTSSVDISSTGSFFRMAQDGGATAAYDATGLLSWQTVWNGVILTVGQINEYMWRPELSGVIADMIIPIWGGSPEIDLSANDDPAGLAGTNTTSTDGPPIMIGDAPI